MVKSSGIVDARTTDKNTIGALMTKKTSEERRNNMTREFNKKREPLFPHRPPCTPCLAGSSAYPFRWYPSRLYCYLYSFPGDDR